MSYYFTIFINILSLIISSFLILKLIEIVSGVYWALTRGSAYTKDMNIALKKWKTSQFHVSEFMQIITKHKRKYNAEDWLIRGLLLKYCMAPGRFVVHYLFRLRLLVLLQIILVFFASWSAVIWVSILVLFITIWIEVIHMLSNRLKFGFADTYFVKRINMWKYRNDEPEIDDLFPTRTEMLGEFTSVFLMMILLMVLSYTAIYYGIMQLFPEAKFFTNVCSDGAQAFFDLLYFTVVTFATVGYGDVTPSHDFLPRFFVTSQLASSFLIVVYLLTSFTMTVEPD